MHWYQCANNLDDSSYSENLNVFKAESTSSVSCSNVLKLQTNLMTVYLSVTQFSGRQVSVLELQKNSIMMVHC